MTTGDERLVEHVTLNVAPTPAAREFYGATLAELGASAEIDQQGRASFGSRGDFGLYDRRGAFFHETHVAFVAESAGAVDRFHAAAIANGGRSIDPPRVRPEFDAHFYSAYVADPAGNLIEALYRSPIPLTDRGAEDQRAVAAKSAMTAGGVRQLRVVVTVDDYDDALRFYRDTLGLPEIGAFTSPGGRISILDAGRATLELSDPTHAAYIDEVEVGRRVAGKIRIALEVDDAAAATDAARAGGAEVVAEPVRTPWDSLNSRLAAPGGLQLTLFTELGE
jgi:lactoylglutathione lyase